MYDSPEIRDEEQDALRRFGESAQQAMRAVLEAAQPFIEAIRKIAAQYVTTVVRIFRSATFQRIYRILIHNGKLQIPRSDMTAKKIRRAQCQILKVTIHSYP